MSKQVILTGLRANNDLHIGNYFVALLPMVDMANKHAGEYQINLFVPDLHSFTTPIDHRSLYAQTMHNLKIFAAAGLDLQNPDLFLYRQSYVPAHSELTWILDCFTDFGEMDRMTQYKDKSGKKSARAIAGEAIYQLRDELGSQYWDDEEIETKINQRIDILNEQNKTSSSMGLLNYPVLMAADILLYGARYVPVGDDQSQHLEFTRDIAERMNRQFADAFPDGLFTLPLPVAKQHEFFGKDQGLRIRDLQNPGKKMSKSDESGKGVIFLGDDPEAAAKKIMSAETDSLAKIPNALDYEKQPGISNLLQVLSLLNQKPLDETIGEWVGKTSYGELKSTVAEKVKTFLADFQARLAQVDEQALQTKLETSEAAMNQVANTTLNKVQRAVGLRQQGRPKQNKHAVSASKPSVISFDDFAKLDVRVGIVTAATAIEGSDKLIELTLDLGTETRTVVTGMREFYAPETFVGKQLPIVANLQAQTFSGTTSHGMLMAAEGSSGPVLLLPENSVPNGSIVR
ncbi:MAG TPA: tryptophan--tRNA ligase [Candidatus Saccharimonadales bacterium]|jgi:tryptophanyl-tRNA synthetase